MNDNWLLKCLPLHICSLFYRIHPGSSLKCSRLITVTFKINDTFYWHTVRHAGQEIEKVQTVSNKSVGLPNSAPIRKYGDTLYIVYVTNMYPYVYCVEKCTRKNNLHMLLLESKNSACLKVLIYSIKFVYYME